MDDHTIERARDEAFRKIGRNVVNFQRMEAMLKLLVKLSGISGSASELEAKARKWHESVDRTSMGSLVKSLLESVFAEPREVASPEEVQEPWLSFRLVIELDESDNEQLKEALEMIVQKRNVLVHQMLAKTDFQSVTEHMVEVLAAILKDPQLVAGRKAWHEAVDRGERLFPATTLGKNHYSCKSCHDPSRKGSSELPITLRNVADAFPRWDPKLKRFVDINEAINRMIAEKLGGDPLPPNDQKLFDLLAYLKTLK